jgi:hypothetical protein
MTIDEVLESDNAIGGEALLQLDTVLELLEAFQNRYPHTFQHLCTEAIATGEMSLGDSIAALAWATHYLAQ